MFLALLADFDFYYPYGQNFYDLQILREVVEIWYIRGWVQKFVEPVVKIHHDRI